MIIERSFTPYLLSVLFATAIVGNVAAQSNEKTKSLKEKYRSIDARTAESESNRKPHVKNIFSAALAPNKKWIVTASDDGSAKIWDVNTGKIEMTLEGHTDGIFSVDISPTGLYIVTGSKDHDVRVWDRKTGQSIRTLKGHTEWVWCVDYSPDGTRIASSSHDRSTKIWDARDGSLIRTLSEPNQWNYSCAFSLDNKRLVIGYPALAILWTVSTGEKVQTFNVGGHENYIQAVAVSPEGNRVAVGGLDRTVRTWNVQTGQLIYEIGNHQGYIQSVDYSPDGEFLVSCSRGDRYALLSRAQTGKLVRKFDCQTPVFDASFSADGKWILTAGSDRALLWDAVSGEPLQEFIGKE